MSIQPTNEPYTGGSGINANIVIGGVVAVLLLIFILQNRIRVSVHFLFFSFRAPLWLIIVVAAVLGGLLDGFVVRGIRKLRGKPAPGTS